MNYMTIDIMNKPFIKSLIREIKLSRTLGSAEKSSLQEKIKTKSFLGTIKKHFNKEIFLKDDIKPVLDFLKEV